MKNFKNMKIKNILILTAGIFIFTACEDFLDVNEDLNNPASTAPANMLPAILANSATLTYNAAEIGTYYAQHLATQNGFSSTRDRWDFRLETRVGIFRHHYFDVAGNAVNMIREAEEDKLSVNYLGIGKVMLAYSFLTTTDVLGDMPFHEAFTGKDSPKYDPQDVVYTGIGKLLDEGIKHLGDAINAGGAVRPMTAGNDPVFEGDLRAWKSFAHGLKARFLIHQTNVGVDLNKVVEQVDLALQNWETPLYPFSGEDVWTRNPWGPTAGKPLPYSMQVNILSGSAPATFFMNYLEKDVDIDPRTYKHFEPNAEGEFIAVESGVGRGSIPREEMPKVVDMALTEDDTDLEYMTEAELHFIKAEASFASNKNAAYNSYIAGIRSDMNRLDVSVEEQNEYLANPAFVVQSADQLTLSNIMIQKFIAMYLQPEAWVDIRRHDWSTTVYPGLTRPANVDETIYGEDKWISRIPYNMETEYIYNLPEIERLGAKDPAFLATKLWWMKK
jgi:hypothetical protein